MTYSNEEVIKGFIGGEKIKNRNVFSDYDYFGRLVLYSYGYHFPIALKLNDCFFVNGNKYSRSTSRHQHIFLNNVHEKIIIKNTQELKTIIDKRGSTEAEIIVNEI